MADYRPQIPAFDRHTKLWTYQDLVDHLVDHYDLKSTNVRQVRKIQRAIETAMRDLPQMDHWLAYDRRYTFSTVAPQTTGTIAYTHSTRTVTLTGATFPTDARFYRLIIGQAHYAIESYTDSTNVVLSQHNNPGADVASLTSYTLYRSEYPCPVNYVEGGRLFHVDDNRELRVISSDMQHGLSIHSLDTPNTPYQVAIRSDGEHYSGLSFLFVPPPDAADLYDFMFTSSARPLETKKYSTGTVTTSGTGVAGSGTAFSDTHVGAVIRFSSDGTTEPTSSVGNDNILNPYAAYRIVQSVTDTTNLVIDTALGTELSAVKYTISDPIDIHTGSMFTALQRLCELELAILENRKITEIKNRQMLFDAALIRAKEYNHKFSRMNQNWVPYNPYVRSNIDMTVYS